MKRRFSSIYYRFAYLISFGLLLIDTFNYIYRTSNMIGKYHSSLSEHGFFPSFFSLTFLILILDWVMVALYGFNFVLNSIFFPRISWRLMAYFLFPISMFLNLVMFSRSVHGIFISGVSIMDYPKFLITEISFFVIISMICALIFMGSVSEAKTTR